MRFLTWTASRHARGQRRMNHKSITRDDMNSPAE